MDISVRTLIDQYAAYTHWANARLLERVMREDASVLDVPVKNSFPSVRATFMHIRNAEAVWRSRLINEAPQWPAEPNEEISTFLNHTMALREEVRRMNDEALHTAVTYLDLKGNAWTQPRWEMLMHCFNHSTYHRGQVITMLRQLGLGDMPTLDMVVFQRLVAEDRAKW